MITLLLPIKGKIKSRNAISPSFEKEKNGQTIRDTNGS